MQSNKPSVCTSYFDNARLSGLWCTIWWISSGSNEDGTRPYKNFVGNNLYYSPSSSSSSSCLTATWFSSRRTCRLQRAIVDDTDLAKTETFASRVMIDSKALSHMKLIKRPHPIGVRHLLAWTFIYFDWAQIRASRHKFGHPTPSQHIASYLLLN